MKNILFYKYINIRDPKLFREQQEQLCQSLQLKGKVLIAKEGINGCLSGENKKIQTYKKAMKKDKRFADIVFKEGTTKTYTFKKLFIRLRKEIVTTRFPALLKNKASYLEPKKLKQWLNQGKDLILLDARNTYESNIGRFKGAVTPPLETFRHWPKAVKKLNKLKKKTIVTYCTGGIRCEKASAYLKKQGFKHVYQLHGGILNYGKECGNKHWLGKCFVFDQRGAVDINPKSKASPITICKYCRTPSAAYHNCKYLKCDKRFISCPKCLKKFKGFCSKNCRNLFQRQQND